VLYLSHVPFENLGLPSLGEDSVATRARTIQHTVHKYFVLPSLLYGVFAMVTFRNRREAVRQQDAEGARS
jgi:hypothetical protein